MKYAVIDIGTNSCRLYVAEAEGQAQRLCRKELITSRLGDGITRSGLLGEAPVARTLDAVAGFVRTARAEGVRDEQLYIYATAVVREAENRADFAARIKERTGVRLIILPGDAEGKIAFLGAAEEQKNCAVLDIGGGSTELTVVDQDGTLCALSQKIGCVRLKEMFDTADGRVDTARVKEYVLANFIPAYGEKLPLQGINKLIGVSGTPTTFASLMQGRKNYDASAVQGAVLSLAALEDELARLARMDTAARRAYSGDFAPRADIIVYGGCLLTALMAYYGFSSVTVSDRDSLEGFLSCVLKNDAPFLLW